LEEVETEKESGTSKGQDKWGGTSGVSFLTAGTSEEREERKIFLFGTSSNALTLGGNRQIRRNPRNPQVAIGKGKVGDKEKPFALPTRLLNGKGTG